MGKFVSLKYDFSFKRLFMNEEVLRGFISDVLDMAPEEIRTVRLANTFLWRRYARQKQGILDILVELNDDSKVNIELQVRLFANWDRRSLFYLAKMYTEDMLVGQKYQKLRRCICINILGFHLDEAPEYHRVYRLRDREGREFSDRFEIHTIELNKPLSGKSRLDDWIRLFQVETREELDMLKTENKGVLAAAEEVRKMNFGRKLRALYDAYKIEQWDKQAVEDYIREEARKEGLEAGRREGHREGLEEGIEQGLEQGMKQGIEQGRIQGMSQGEERFGRLALCLAADKRYEDLERAAGDREFREKLYQEYSI